MERSPGNLPGQREQVTVLVPHGNILAQLASEYAPILRTFAPLQCPVCRFAPLCCFLSVGEISPEVWKTRIGSCKILPPVLNGNVLVYPVELTGPQGELWNPSYVPDFAKSFLHPARPITGIIIGFIPGDPGSQDFRQISGSFPARPLRVFQICKAAFFPLEGIRYSWSLEKPLWNKKNDRAVLHSTPDHFF
jgi:hypothetical protein